MKPTVAGESGVALVAALLAVMLLTVLGTALVLLTMSETLTASNFARSSEAAYAADALAERALGDLEGARDWTSVLAGTARATLVDGSPSGTRTLADGSTINLDEIVNIADCDQATACSAADMDAVTMDRPWGRNNPRWQLYTYGPLSALPGATGSSFYVVVLAGDDGSENDNNPAVDGGTPASGEMANPGAGVLLLRAEAFGPGGAHGRVDLTVRRSVRVLSWREVP